MLYSFVLTILLLNPFGEKVSFTILNDTSEVISLAVDLMPELTLQPLGTSEMRLSKNEKVYVIIDTQINKKSALFEVDESLEGKQVKLKRLIHQIKKQAKN